jgi:hypothetical protein
MLGRLRKLVGLPRPSPAVADERRDPAWGVWAPDARWLASRRSTAATYVAIDDVAIERLRSASPAECAALIQQAERAMRHEFDLLGSGPFVPRDPARPPRGAYLPIDWFLDPVRTLRFAGGVHHRSWNLYEMRPANADVKYPWELARAQHLATLGQAFRLTGDPRFAVEVVDQILDFVEANPAGFGVNWTCTMDVGLRAVSWVVALDLVRLAQLEDAHLSRVYSALFDHGRFIRANLENTYEVTSNHFLSNVVGLWFLAAAFGDLDEGQQWAAFAREAIEQEMDVQVLPDGADFESSIPYHRLVAELLLGSLRLGDVTGRPLSNHFRSRVREMIEYLSAVTRPDGLMPQVGDADDGRLHLLRHAAPQDGRHLLGPAAAIFERPEWLRQGGAAAAWEATWWGLDAKLAPAPAVAPPARLFSQAGHAVVRDGGTYLLVTNSVVGTKGFGNHKHNDQLSFEYHSGGGALIVDPGSYVYTSDPAARNLFRGTAYHNTLMIDGAEQNKVNPEWLFRMFEQARAEHVRFIPGGDVVEYHGRHHGYEVLPDPVTHERKFRLERSTGRLAIADRLSGRGAHRLTWHFHFAPGVAATLDAGMCRLHAPWATAVLEYPRESHAEVNTAWYSPSYGVRTSCQALDLRIDVDLELTAEWLFAVIPVTP